MENKVKKIAGRFIRKHKLTTINYSELKAAVNNMGYTVIEFDKNYNDEDVSTIIENLNLSEAISVSRGFTLVTNDFRLIFISENLNDEEKLLVLAHEVGHIACGHFSNVPIIGKDVIDEYEASEFSHYLLNRGYIHKIMDYICVCRRTSILSLIALCLAVIFLCVNLFSKNETEYKDDFYITSTGQRYHRKECIHIKNKTNVEKLTVVMFESGDYSPCAVCLPDEE